MHSVCLHKHQERFYFEWEPGDEEAVLSKLTALAADPTCPLTLMDASVMAMYVQHEGGLDPARIVGGIDEPGLEPARAGDVSFEIARRGKDGKLSWVGYVPIDATLASKAWLDILGDEAWSKPWILQ